MVWRIFRRTEPGPEAKAANELLWSIINRQRTLLGVRYRRIQELEETLARVAEAAGGAPQVVDVALQPDGAIEALDHSKLDVDTLVRKIEGLRVSMERVRAMIWEGQRPEMRERYGLHDLVSRLDTMQKAEERLCAVHRALHDQSLVSPRRAQLQDAVDSIRAELKKKTENPSSAERANVYLANIQAILDSIF